jgi:hypothetical protein
MDRSSSWDSSKAFSKLTDIPPTIRSAGREWYTPLVGLMLEDSFSRRCSCLKEYFDPSSGKLQERVERLIKKDGELEQVLRRQIGADDSEMVRALAPYLGGHSPLMKVLDPEEASGVVQKLRESVDETLEEQRNRILSEFSLDNKEGALSRLVAEIEENDGDLQKSLTGKIDEVVGEFSLDDENSALSRLVRKVEVAQQTISREFSLDNETSALSRISMVIQKATETIDNNLTLDKEQSALARLRRELVEVLKKQELQANAFQNDVKSALAEIRTKREQAARSTIKGLNFEAAVWEFVQKEAQGVGDIPENTGSTTGATRGCKVGDCVVTLGEDCAAAGEKVVMEAKNAAGYDLPRARQELAVARTNREASVGVFIFSKEAAPIGQETLLRQGSDVFVVWDAEDVHTDVYFRVALMLAKALCVRAVKARNEEVADFEKLDKAIAAVQHHAERLVKVQTWTETIQRNSVHILEEVRKMSEGLETQISVLRESTEELKDEIYVSTER